MHWDDVSCAYSLPMCRSLYVAIIAYAVLCRIVLNNVFSAISSMCVGETRSVAVL